MNGSTVNTALMALALGVLPAMPPGVQPARAQGAPVQGAPVQIAPPVPPAEGGDMRGRPGTGREGLGREGMGREGMGREGMGREGGGGDRMGPPGGPMGGMERMGPGGMMGMERIGPGGMNMDEHMRRRGEWRERRRLFALLPRADDLKLTPPDVQKIAEAFLLWQGNHTWRVINAAVDGDVIGFDLATAEGSVIARFTMDPRNGRVRRRG